MRNGAANFKTLGILWLVYAVLRVVAVAWLVMNANTLSLMWGALLNRVPDALGWMAFFHAMLAVVIAWCVICAIFAFAAGYALMRGAASARMLGIVAALVSLPELPFGVALGAYTLAALVPMATAGPQAVSYSPSPVTPVRPVTPLRARESH